MTVPNERTPLLEPQIGFNYGTPMQSVSAPYASVDAHHLLVMMEPRHPKERITLRSPGIPMPDGGYNVVALTGGRQSYYRSLSHTNKHAPWYYRMANGRRECFVVWGRPIAGGKIYSTSGTARTSSGHGAIYTRWPIINERGSLTGYGWEVRVVRFQVLDKQPAKGDVMLLELLHQTRGYGRNDSPIPYGADKFTQRLVTQARDGFDRSCNDGLDPVTEKWRNWFLNQRHLQEKSNLYTDAHIWRGWLEELDKVTEAWQLGHVLAHYRHMFPEYPPRESEEYLRRVLSEDPNARLLAIPEYEGTDGGREYLLMEAYFRLRPTRRELFGQWMTDFVVLTNKFRNYTGD